MQRYTVVARCGGAGADLLPHARADDCCSAISSLFTFRPSRRREGSTCSAISNISKRFWLGIRASAAAVGGCSARLWVRLNAASAVAGSGRRQCCQHQRRCARGDGCGGYSWRRYFRWRWAVRAAGRPPHAPADAGRPPPFVGHWGLAGNADAARRGAALRVTAAPATAHPDAAGGRRRWRWRCRREKAPPSSSSPSPTCQHARC